MPGREIVDPSGPVSHLHATRRTLVAALLAAPFGEAWARLPRAVSRRVSIVALGARSDSATINTPAIQATINRLAASGGGTVVVPSGVFVSGALFFKPGVNLHLEEGAVLRCAADVEANFPRRRTRIEGHFEERFTPALINAEECDGFTISGKGTLDGAGRPVWDRFWQLRRAAADPGNFPNIGLPRARLALIARSRNVTVEGVTFSDSQFWNLHLYACQDVVVRNAKFQVPDDYPQAPSTDGIDLDSCQRVLIEGCFFSVTDDCIAAKGSRGPHARDDSSSPAVEHIRVRRCVFKRGSSMLTLGSEATIVRDAVVEDCRITGPVKVAVLKLRSDTAQHYEDIHYRNIVVAAPRGPLLTIQPWSQYTDLKGQPAPQSIVRNISFADVRGSAGSFGIIRPNPGQTMIEDIRFSDIDVRLSGEDTLAVAGVRGLRFDHVVVNGRQQEAPLG